MKPREGLHRLTATRLKVEGQSMEPAYASGSWIWVSRSSYLLTSPTRGHVVAIRSPEHPAWLELKRIIGLPGEEIAWQGGAFRINSSHLNEPYACVPSVPPGDDERRVYRLSRGQYFVAGDHRLYSRDSRHYGPIDRAAILGQVLP